MMLLAAAAFAAGCGSSADSADAAADGPPERGGVVTIGADQQPACLNNKIVCGTMAATSEITGPLYDELITINKEGVYAPKMATRIPSTANGDVVETPDGGMTVKISVVPQARWSDGRPVTCEDLVFTWKTMMDERWTVAGRNGWDLITKIDCLDQRTALYTFKERYALFMGIVGGPPMPKHVLDGKDFNTFLNDKITVTSGPYLFDHWTRSVEIVLKRNPNYWNKGAEEKPYLDELRWVFVPNTNTLKIQLRTGEVDMISPPPDSTLIQELKGMSRVQYQSEPDVYWEQLAFNNAKFPTNELAVRQAIAYSVDREQIADVVLKKQVGVLDSPILPAQKGYHVPSYKRYRADSKKAQEVLEKAGWKKDGAYYAKGGKPLVVTFKSTAGNDLRLKVAQLMQQALKQNGIRMEISMEPAEVFFGQTTVQGTFHLGLWAWSSSIEPSMRNILSCDKIPSEANEYSGQNNYRWCNKRATKLLKAADVEPDTAQRQAMTREVQEIMADEMPVLPIFQRPGTIAYGLGMRGVDINPLAGRTWNTYEWSVAK